MNTWIQIINSTFYQNAYSTFQSLQKFNIFKYLSTSIFYKLWEPQSRGFMLNFISGNCPRARISIHQQRWRRSRQASALIVLSKFYSFMVLLSIQVLSVEVCVIYFKDNTDSFDIFGFRLLGIACLSCIFTK